MSLLVNRAKQVTATTGVGTVTLGLAVTTFQTFNAAGAVDGRRYQYLIEDGTNWEIGSGVLGAGGSTLTRTLVASSTGGLLALTGAATVACVAQAAETTQVIEKKTFTGGETSFTFSSIPPDYSDLEVEFFGRSSNAAGATDMSMTVNGGVSGIYDRQRMWKGGTGTALSGADSQLGTTGVSGWAVMCGTTTPAGMAAGSIMRIQGYATTLHKTFYFEVFKWPNGAGVFDNLVLEGSGGFRLTVPITSIEIPSFAPHALVAGSYAVLRGIP